MNKNINVKVYIIGDTPVMRAMNRVTVLVDAEIVNTMAEADFIVCGGHVRTSAAIDNNEKHYAIIATTIERPNFEIPDNVVVFQMGFNLPDYYAFIAEISQKNVEKDTEEINIVEPIVQETAISDAKTILVIDDAPKNIKSAKEFFSGHYLTITEGYDQAMDILSKEKFEIVLTDLYLPMSAETLSQEAFKLGQLVPYGFLLMCEAAINGAKYIAVVSDLGHHDDHFSAAFDHFYSIAFKIENAKTMMLHAQLTNTGAKDWQNALEKLLKEER